MSEQLSISPDEPEQLPEVRLFDKEQQSFLSPIFHDPEIVAQLDTSDNEFIADVVAILANHVFESKKVIYGTHVSLLWATTAFDLLGQGLSPDAIAKEFDSSGRTSKSEIIKNLREFSRAASQLLKGDPELDANIMLASHDYVREKKNSALVTDVLYDPELGLRDVLEELLKKGFLEENEYYSFGVHAGTFVFKGDTPTGDTEQEIEKRRKRALVAPTALQSAIKKISKIYKDKQKTIAARYLGEPQLRFQAQQFLSLLLGSRVDRVEPMPMTKILEKHHLDRVTGKELSREQVDRYLVEALAWTYTPARKSTD